SYCLRLRPFSLPYFLFYIPYFLFFFFFLHSFGHALSWPYRPSSTPALGPAVSNRGRYPCKAPAMPSPHLFLTIQPSTYYLLIHFVRNIILSFLTPRRGRWRP
ncbi:MAG TPA: hypothetical protein VFG54_14800, partial [Prolixibacteraceae bacterium]|nr:hypothetical protein [Prolixibacteraceae bacterium]